MNDDIKQILRDLEFASGVFDYTITPNRCTFLKDYITNLQQENEMLINELKLQKGATRLFKNDLANVMGNFMETVLDAFENQEKELEDYKSRIEKVE